MHVEGAEPGLLQERHRQHVAVVEREDQIRVADIRGRVSDDAKTFPSREVEKAAVPAVLVGVVPVRDHERHLEAGLEQRRRAADAYVPVAEDDRFCGCHVSAAVESFSSTAWTSQRGRSRTCW